jgi:hypothetical protein
MERLVLQAETVAQLHNLDRYVQICDQTGRILGHFTPAMDQPLELLAERLPERPFQGEEVPAPCDLPRGKGEQVEAREGGERLPEPIFLLRE